MLMEEDNVVRKRREAGARAGVVQRQALFAASHALSLFPLSVSLPLSFRVTCSNCNPEQITCDHLFMLCGAYGDVEVRREETVFSLTRLWLLPLFCPLPSLPLDPLTCVDPLTCAFSAFPRQRRPCSESS